MVLAVEASRGSWIARAEAEIRRLRDVDGASIQAEGDEILEIHVLSRSERPPKQIVRDIQTLLLTRFNRTVDHRKVSVALSLPAESRSEEAEPAAPAAARIRFESVNLFVSGPRTQAQVELKWKGVPRMGSASGWSSRDDAHRLVAQAALAAACEFLSGDVAFSLGDAEVSRIGRHEVAVVTLTLLAHRQEKSLVGCCAVGRDTPQAVVLATLAALNRVIGGLRMREPTEYVLRPTST